MLTIIEELPWAFAVNGSEVKNYCHFCFNRITDSVKCNGCRFAHYCSPQCMLNAVRDHKDECCFLRLAGGQVPNERTRLLGRIIMKLGRGDGYPNPRVNFSLEDFVQRSYFDLKCCERQISADEERMNEFRSTREQLEAYMANSTLPETRVLFRIYCRMIMNVFNITGSTMLPVGIGIYVALTQVKHSCSPNCVIVYNGITARLNYLGSNDERKSELCEYSINYLPLIGSRDERRRALKKRYYFTCNCSKCMDDHQSALETECTCPDGSCSGHEFVIGGCGDEKSEKGIEASYPKDLVIRTPADFARVKRQARRGNGPAVSRLDHIYTAAKDFLEKHETMLAPTHVELVRTEAVLAKAAYFKGSYNEAITLYENIIWRLDRHMPENLPLLSLAEIAVSRLCLMTGDLARTKRHLLNACDLTRACYGRQHAIHNMVLRFLDGSDRRMMQRGLVPYGIVCRAPIKPVKVGQEKPSCVTGRDKQKKDDKEKNKKQ